MLGAPLFLQLVGAAPAGPNDPAASPPSVQRDSTYGRIDGDLEVVAGVGATVGPDSPRATIDLRLRYLETAGVFFTYEDGPLFGHGAEPARVLAAGLEVRPLFLARWLTGHESGVARLDLALDSLAFELGGFLGQPQGQSFGDRPGLQMGLGLELPVFARASGLWFGLHGGLRLSDAALAGGPTSDPADRALFLGITLAWHQVFGAHAVDVRDRAPR
jgi:hypothetical protein